MNKYQQWYHDITSRGQARTLDQYTESHHIHPKSLGGTDDAENITILTAREHFICHWLLTKIYSVGEEHWKMLNALRIMRAENKRQNRYSTKITSRVYQHLKEEYSMLQSQKFSGEGNGFFGKNHSEEAKKRISEANKGDRNGSKRPEAKEKIAASKRGKKRDEFGDEWRQNLRQNHKSKQPGFDGAHSEETRQKIGDRLRGRVQSEEEKLARSLANKGKKKPRLLCPHCEQHIAVNTYARWHGDKCKHRA